MIFIFKKLYPEVNIFLTLKIKEAFVLGGLDDLEEVVGNIIENACKYGNKKIQVEIKIGKDDK